MTYPPGSKIEIDGYDVCVEAEAFGSEGWKPLTLSVRGKVVDGDSLPIHVAKITQALEEGIKSWRALQRARIERKKTEPRKLFGLLRTRHKRPHSGRAAEKCDELAPSQLVELHPIHTS
jgi:hypothetical protein